jgi:hypothetical protein
MIHIHTWSKTESGVLDSRSKLVGFHMSGMTTGTLPGLQRSSTQKGSGKEWADKTHIERARSLMTNCKFFIFLSKLYTKEEET